MNRFTLAFGAAMLLAGCGTVERQGRLYPTNDQAVPGGVLVARFLVRPSNGTGSGAVEMTLPGGEQVKGEFTIVRSGTIAFGSAFAAAFNKVGGTNGFASGSSYAVEGSSPGVATGVGDKGTSVHCEFYNDNNSGHGYGGCTTSTGASYRLQY